MSWSSSSQRIIDQVTYVVQPRLHRHELSNRHRCLPVDGELRPVRRDGCAVVQCSSIGEHVQDGRCDPLRRRPRHRHRVPLPRHATRGVTKPCPHIHHGNAIVVHAQRAAASSQRRFPGERRHRLESSIDHEPVPVRLAQRLVCHLSPRRQNRRSAQGSTTLDASRERPVLGPNDTHCSLLTAFR